MCTCGIPTVLYLFNQLPEYTTSRWHWNGAKAKISHHTLCWGPISQPRSPHTASTLYTYKDGWHWKCTPFFKIPLTSSFLLSPLQLTTTQDPQVVKHFLYTAWPDHGVPQYTVSIHRFICQDVRPVYNDSSAPLIVHCRWGDGMGGGGEEAGDAYTDCVKPCDK